MNNKKLYISLSNSFFEAMSSRKFDSMKDIMHEDISFDFPGTKLLEGQKRVLIFLNALSRKYKSLTFDISDILVDNNQAAVVWKNFGKTIDCKEYSNNGMTLIRFKDDKIIFLSDYFKNTSFTEKQFIK